MHRVARRMRPSLPPPPRPLIRSAHRSTPLHPTEAPPMLAVLFFRSLSRAPVHPSHKEVRVVRDALSALALVAVAGGLLFSTDAGREIMVVKKITADDRFGNPLTVSQTPRPPHQQAFPSPSASGPGRFGRSSDKVLSRSAYDSVVCPRGGQLGFRPKGARWLPVAQRAALGEQAPGQYPT